MATLLERLREALAPTYEVERELATGGMGSVFLARDPTLDRSVAIKILRPDLASGTASERFLREARILAKLSHPNVVPVHAAGEAEGLSYYVMEYVNGETLKERLERGTMRKQEVLKLANDLLSALEEAHKHGIVHRDVKPSNIFLVDDRARLGDFGIAKPSEGSSDGLTASGYRIGTPGYMAPEQLFGDKVTPATDIYAAALVICEAVTSRHWSMPVRADEVDWSGVPSELITPLQRALEFSAEERWQDAASFRDALARPQHSAARRRVVIAAVASIAAVVVAAGWFASRGAFQELGSVESEMPPLIRKQVTFTGKAYLPAIAPDGQSVAFVSVSSGSMRLMVQAIDGGEPVELLRAGALVNLRWSRDGSEILFYAQSALADSGWVGVEFDPSTKPGHFAVPRLGGEPRFLLREFHRTESPDGSQTASSKYPLPGTMTIRDLASGDSMTVSLPGDSLEISDLRWSPAGDVIAVRTRDDLYQAIWTVVLPDAWAQKSQNASWRRAEAVTNKVAEDTVDLLSPRWSPRGDALYFNRAGLLWRVDISPVTGPPSRPGPGQWTGTEVEGYFSISGDGKRLVYTEIAGGSNVWVGDFTGPLGEHAGA